MNLNLFKRKKRDIILIHLPPWTFESPPIGMAYLNSFLLKKQIKTSVLDLNIKLYHFSKEYRKRLKNINYSFHDLDDFLDDFRKGIDYYLDKVVKKDVKLVAIGVNRYGVKIANYVCKYIKSNSNKKIIIGGYITPIKGELVNINKTYVDFIIHGQANSSLFKLIDAFYNNNSVKIPGVTVLKNGEILYSEKVNQIERISNSIYPRYKGFNLKDYTTKRFSIILSTGCISNCAYCSDRNLSGSYRFRDPDNILEEIKYLKTKGANFIYFDDLAINGHPSKLSKFCDLLIESKIRIPWGGNAIPYKKFSSDLVIKMKKAGCQFLRFGVETGSNELLKRINKISTVEDSIRLLSVCTKVGIETHINLIVGLPGETEEDFQKTLSFVKENKNYIKCIANIHTAYITPKSEYENHPDNYGLNISKKDFTYYWSDDKGNTYEVREKRLYRLVKLCHELGIDMINISAFNKYSCKYKDIKDNFQDYLNLFSQ